MCADRGVSLGPLLTYKKRGQTSRIILHDTHTVPDKANLVAWLRVNGRINGLLDIGYHYVVFPDGKHLCTRPHDVMGSHTRGFNHESIGVALAGGRAVNEEGEVEPFDTFTPTQLNGLRDLVHELRLLYGPLPLVGKSELGTHKYTGYPNPATDMERIRALCPHPST